MIYQVHVEEDSGFIYDYAGHIITNNHVITVEGQSLGDVNVEVTFYDEYCLSCQSD